MRSPTLEIDSKLAVLVAKPNKPATLDKINKISATN